MFYIQGDKIVITKGDSAALRVKLSNVNGEPYEMKTGDTLTMTVRQAPGREVLMEVVSQTEVIEMPPTLTKNLIVGQCCYDVELRTGDNVYTVIGIKNSSLTSNMTVLPEITE